MSPLNREPLMGTRVPAGLRPLPPPRFGNRLGNRPGMPMRMPPLPPPPSMSMFGPSAHRQRLLPPPLPPSRCNGMLPLFPGGPRSRSMAPIPPPIGPRVSGMPRGPLMRPWPRRIPPPQMMPLMRPRFTGNGNIKGNSMNVKKSFNKAEELESKKPWMTDEIQNEIQKKNKLYTKAKKTKTPADWEEFKEMRNKVTKMIREAKSEYVAKNSEQDDQNSDNSNSSEGVQKDTEQSKQTDQTEETQPSSEQAHLYPLDEEPYDQRDENSVSTDEETSYYCEMCDKDFPTEDALSEHNSTHITCGIDGCTFSAYRLLVEKHINMQHLTGLYQRMKDLSTPEDIEKWIMERKKKYPTQANINLRKAEELEKSQRGEVIKQRSSDVRMKSRVAHKREKKRRNRFTHEIKNIDCTHTDESYRGLRPFPGISVLNEEHEECSDEKAMQTNLFEKITGYISDEDDIPHASETLEKCDVNLPTTSLPIFTLVADYESESDDGPEEVPVKKIKMKDPQNDKITENIVPEIISSTICEESSEKNDKLNKESRNSATNHNKGKQETNQTAIKNTNKRILHKYHNKLLEKLLTRAIQHERNIICQCMKYIIENNFFDLN